MSDTAEKFESWAVLEIMGHSRFAGLVTEQTMGGCAFVRIDVPAVNGRLAFTKLFGQSAIFAITPCTEEVARQVAAQCYSRPVEVYAPSVQRSLIEHDDRDEYGDD